MLYNTALRYAVLCCAVPCCNICHYISGVTTYSIALAYSAGCSDRCEARQGGNTTLACHLNSRAYLLQLRSTHSSSNHPLLCSALLCPDLPCTLSAVPLDALMTLSSANTQQPHTHLISSYLICPCVYLCVHMLLMLRTGVPPVAKPCCRARSGHRTRRRSSDKHIHHRAAEPQNKKQGARRPTS